MTRNGHVRFGERSRETRLSQDSKVRSAPTLFSPLLLNIALHGLETTLLQAYKVKERPQVVRYADDFAIFHPTQEGVKKAQTLVEGWLREMGLELKPSKTRLSQTLVPYQGNVGMDFLGCTIRQTPVGKNRTGTNGHGPPLGFKTIITPSKEAIEQQLRKLRAIYKWRPRGNRSHYPEKSRRNG